MEQLLQIRIANDAEIPWINERYNEIKFIPSESNKDLTLVAEFRGHKAGVGRLTKISETEGELGGIYVFPEFRGHGIARKLVDSLISRSPYHTLYCLPFSHLRDFYEEMGFRDPHPTEKSQIPEKVLNKQNWCTTEYKDQTPVLMRKLPQS
ncbi:MAG: GNAT family N-acetyltransferase [Oligoflexia bacterium]|nr:GNAT family N-acetyltransferase [Oligoflexia bacterium]